MMIARLWHGFCPLRNADLFQAFLGEEVAGFEGYVASYTKRIDVDQNAHFYVCTYWPSVAALLEFTGEKPEYPIDDPMDRLYEVVSDPIVAHFPIATIADPFDSMSTPTWF